MIALFSPQEFTEFVVSNSVAMIHFWAEWNAYDMQMKMSLNDLEKTYSKVVGFGSVHVD